MTDSLASRLKLSERDRAFLAGDMGEAGVMSMRILVTMAQAQGAGELLDIEGSHVDGCLLHGYSGLEFAERMVAGGAQVQVPTTLNVGATDLLRPQNHHGTARHQQQAARLMECYRLMGCEPMYTCAPYQALDLRNRPQLGQQVAWAESNAIVFANSVLGARTERYGDFLDICCAVTGRAPAVGLHLEANRRATWRVDVSRLPEALLGSDAFFPVLGYWLGSEAGRRVPVIEGLPTDCSEDQLKALGAAAASSGALALFHAVGVTPEAPTLEAACQGVVPEEVAILDLETVRRTRQRLSTESDGAINAVAVGSPHLSLVELRRLARLVEEYPPQEAVEVVACTSRFMAGLAESQGVRQRLEEQGVRVVVDTCVVVAPILTSEQGILMTDSGKFSHYTPGNLGMGVIYGSTSECVRSAHQGSVWRDRNLWGEAP